MGFELLYGRKYDIQRTDGVDRDPERVKLLMRSYARHQGAAVNYSVIYADIRKNGYLGTALAYCITNGSRKPIRFVSGRLFCWVLGVGE